MQPNWALVLGIIMANVLSPILTGYSIWVIVKDPDVGAETQVKAFGTLCAVPVTTFKDRCSCTGECTKEAHQDAVRIRELQFWRDIGQDGFVFPEVKEAEQ